MLLGLVVTGSIQGDVLEYRETFSGNGPYSNSQGQSGFEVDGWTVQGPLGSFGTNSFGEQVYSSVSDPNLNTRFIRQIAGPGMGDFDTVFEISNFDMSLTESASEQGFVYSNFFGYDPGGQWIQSTLIIYRTDSIGLQAAFSQFDAANVWTAGSVDLDDNAERLTFHFKHRMNGGNPYLEALIQTDETGNFQSLGRISNDNPNAPYLWGTDGLVQFFGLHELGNGFALAEYDLAQTSSIPEPGMPMAMVLAACASRFVTRSQMRRRR